VYCVLIATGEERTTTAFDCTIEAGAEKARAAATKETEKDDASTTPDEESTKDDASTTPDEKSAKDDASTTPDEKSAKDDASTTPDEKSAKDNAPTKPDDGSNKEEEEKNKEEEKEKEKETDEGNNEDKSQLLCLGAFFVCGILFGLTSWYFPQFADVSLACAISVVAAAAAKMKYIDVNISDSMAREDASLPPTTASKMMWMEMFIFWPVVNLGLTCAVTYLRFKEVESPSRRWMVFLCQYSWRFPMVWLVASFTDLMAFDTELEDGVGMKMHLISCIFALIMAARVSNAIHGEGNSSDYVDLRQKWDWLAKLKPFIFYLVGAVFVGYCCLLALFYEKFVVLKRVKVLGDSDELKWSDLQVTEQNFPAPMNKLMIVLQVLVPLMAFGSFVVILYTAWSVQNDNNSDAAFGCKMMRWVKTFSVMDVRVLAVATISIVALYNNQDAIGIYGKETHVYSLEFEGKALACLAGSEFLHLCVYYLLQFMEPES